MDGGLASQSAHSSLVLCLPKSGQAKRFETVDHNVFNIIVSG